jgi:hypothetical protein
LRPVSLLQESRLDHVVFQEDLRPWEGEGGNGGRGNHKQPTSLTPRCTLWAAALRVVELLLI